MLFQADDNFAHCIMTPTYQTQTHQLEIAKQMVGPDYLWQKKAKIEKWWSRTPWLIFGPSTNCCTEKKTLPKSAKMQKKSGWHQDQDNETPRPGVFWTTLLLIAKNCPLLDLHLDPPVGRLFSVEFFSKNQKSDPLGLLATDLKAKGDVGSYFGGGCSGAGGGQPAKTSFSSQHLPTGGGDPLK